MVHKILRALIILLAGIIIGIGFFRWKLAQRSAPYHSTVGSTQIPGASINEFKFTDQSRNKVGLQDLKGSYWIADFIFTRCQGPCPLLTATMSRLQKEFHHRSDLKYVSFTVDPEYDTPQVLSSYADTFGAEKNKWFFLSGPKEEVYDLIKKGFQVAVGHEHNDPIQVVHSLSFILMGKKGEILGRYNTTEPEELAQLKKDIAALP